MATVKKVFLIFVHFTLYVINDDVSVMNNFKQICVM